MKKVDEIVKNYEDNRDNSLKSKEEAISELYALRNKMFKLVDSANRTLQKRCDELRNINKKICEIQGHTYTDWKEHDGFIDRSWFYTRECEICGIIERVDYEPAEYREQQLRKVRKK